MAVLLLCPNLRCRKILSVPEGIRGKTVKCQHCQTMVRVPDKQLQPPVQAAAAAPANKK
jgi:LSD1 subclass zinc finger protein